ncbi:MAG: dihydrodipicolinate synthase family protein [Streptosporangiales bacterium]|nr:dihydrodipicolinate synthase family protein [Streptosporangiales bacterium]MBO0891649.1 dihydrodipicolinate synthase family protein [Acidothermales bacterium]
MPTLRLPVPDGTVRPYTFTGRKPPPPPDGPARSRIAYAAVHVVADPLADNTPGRPARLDWDATLAYRHHLWRHGLGVADAMDTAQRGMGLDWPATRELIRRVGAEPGRGALVCGAGTDQLPARVERLDDVTEAYLEQCQVVEDAGATVALMASRQLAAVARGPDDYPAVYGKVLRQLTRPALLHWLGPMFDPALTGYWGSADLDAATESVLGIVDEHADRIDGVKVSLLDAAREAAFRCRLPDGVRCYTGDDFGYPELIRGDENGASDALLGVFDPIAPVAAAALHALDAGDGAAYERWLAPTVPLARHLFGEPTYHYKTGIVFLSWLAGHQEHFTMVSGMQGARSVPHLARAAVLADEACLLPDAELAAARLGTFLAVAGVDA